MKTVPYQVALRIHAKVNRDMQFHTDMDLYNKRDFWAIADSGDCEDFALVKRSMLADLGYTGASVRLMLCITEEDESHAVLIVTTDKGEYVLDNRHDLPQTRETLTNLGYTWLRIEQEGKWYYVV